MGNILDTIYETTEKDAEIIKTFGTKQSLCGKIFVKEGDSYKMDSEIRKSLIKISDDFIDSLGLDIFVHDVILTGSLANYNWSKYSDVDLHLLVDISSITDGKKGLEEIVTELFNAKKSLWNELHDVTIKGFDVEVYIQDIDEEHDSTGVYSISKNKWLVEPNYEKPSIDEKLIMKKSNEFMKQIDKLINKEESDLKKQSKEITKLFTKIRKFRKSGLTKGGVFSYENLTFKLLRRNGYFEKLFNFKEKIDNKNLTV